MWKRLVLSLHVLFQTYTLFYPPFCSASEVTSHNSASFSHAESTLASVLPTGALGALVIANTTLTVANATFESSTAITSALPVSLLNNATTSSTAAAVQPTQTIDPFILEDIQTIQARRLSSIIGAVGSAAQIPAWLSTLRSNGKWSDSEVDYTTGCAARRANWPAQTHWQRILIMASAWHGGVNGADQFIKNADLRAAISSAMDYWFSRDFSNLACLDSGGTPACPCDNLDNSLCILLDRNTNWFSNIILIPELVSQTCLLLNDTLVPSQVDNCTHMISRTYDTFGRTINGLGTLTGANTLDVAKIGMDQALLTYNASLLTDVFRRVHLELQIKNGIKADGIRADGSFGQHGGILYNGNYGKDYTNDVLDLEVEAGGTIFAADSNSQNAFATLFDGDRWMIFRNTITGALHWDFSALGRFISFPVIDAQATGNIKINVTEVLELGQQWSSSTLINFANDLALNATNANAGQLLGNRMFYANDYMVHRGRNYVTTLKMYSTRTINTECVNSQNPKGFHLSDGVLYTYLQGNEYEDISAAWDWNLIPGITVDYDATPLVCGTTRQTGLENFVGGVSDDKIGVGVMRYSTPLTKTLHWQKVWFFLNDDVQHIMVSALSSTTNASVLTVLDQKRYAGSFIVDGESGQSMKKAGVQTLWHGDVGYAFNNSVSASVQVGEKTGAWSTIGTSTQPPVTVDLFAAWIEHNSLSTPVAYTAFPGTSHSTFIQKNNQLHLQTVQNDGNISAVYDETHNTAMFVFWNVNGGSATINTGAKFAPITLTSTGNVAIIYKLESGEVTVSDPSQTLTTAQISLVLGIGRKPVQWGAGRSTTLIFQLPSDGLAGSSVTQTID